MTQSRKFCSQLAQAANDMLFGQLKAGGTFAFSEAAELWSALGGNQFTVRMFETENIANPDDYPVDDSLPLYITLTVDVWGSKPCVHIAATFDNGNGTAGFSCTLDYVQLPSDLKRDNLFVQWLKSFANAIGIEDLFDTIYQRIIDEKVPVGIDTIVLSAGRVGDSLQEFDIEQVDVTVSCVSKDAQLAVPLPFLALRHWDIFYLTTVSCPSREDKEVRTYLNATAEFSGAQFDITSEFPFENVEAAMGDRVVASEEASHRVATSAPPEISMQAFAQSMTSPGRDILAELPWKVGEVTMLFDCPGKQMRIEGQAQSLTKLDDTLGIKEVSMSMDCTFTAAGESSASTVTLLSATVEGIFHSTAKPDGSWFSAQFDVSPDQLVGSLRLARESDPQVDDVKNFLQLLLKLTDFQTSASPVYFDRPNHISKPEQRGGDANPWLDKFPPAQDSASASSPPLASSRDAPEEESKDGQ